ncbi:doubled CXXCH motif protein [Geobacter sp. OR-1]|uniref:cytochrome c3 family protein n=1 Tax=Geobacter sp. OR-1 TaxID=1266765 RepID=UPI0005425474|nr:cytochrome c3 family protein [Geobacter sp. OR-1]GAM07902.1 doubled CXXCH motif protein [Geobacter sp. OR-1]
MVSNNIGIRNCLKKIARSAGVATLLLMSSLECSAATAEGEKPGCDYQVYLEAPSEKAEYLAMRQEMELIARIRMENLAKGESTWTFGSSDNPRELDDNSKECISCHEQKGRNAADDIKDKNHPGMAAISVTHAIGTDYIRASSIIPNLRKANALPSSMILINGKIACVTCHNPLNAQRYNLSVAAANASLCFTCHIL